MSAGLVGVGGSGIGSRSAPDGGAEDGSIPEWTGGGGAEGGSIPEWTGGGADGGSMVGCSGAGGIDADMVGTTAGLDGSITGVPLRSRWIGRLESAIGRRPCSSGGNDGAGG
jgi:hypothetical protein